MSSPPTSLTALPPNFTSALDRRGRIYYINHTTRTTSYTHPLHPHHHEPYTPDLPYPFERLTSIKGRAYYADHAARTTSWLNPVKLAELKERGLIGEGMGEEAAGEDERARPWVVEEKAGAPREGEVYYVDYRTGKIEPDEGCGDWATGREAKL
ncbi:hypothetical protein MMC13_001594 [Lambiella insularis]|nr:hypothetical protein [Lambiella insularis]